jgi:hypothetical protein
MISSAVVSNAPRHTEAERFGGFEVDHQFKLGRLLHGEIRLADWKGPG